MSTACYFNAICLSPASHGTRYRCFPEWWLVKPPIFALIIWPVGTKRSKGLGSYSTALVASPISESGAYVLIETREPYHETFCGEMALDTTKRVLIIVYVSYTWFIVIFNVLYGVQNISFCYFIEWFSRKDFAEAYNYSHQNLCPLINWFRYYCLLPE